MVAKPAQPADRPPPTVAELEAIYQFREPAEVRAFLTAHPEVLPVAAEAASKISEFVPVEERLVLEFGRDPEDEDDEGQVFALVPTRLDPDEIRPGFDRFLRDWLVEAGRSVGLLFNVGIEYR